MVGRTNTLSVFTDRVLYRLRGRCTQMDAPGGQGQYVSRTVPFFFKDRNKEQGGGQEWGMGGLLQTRSANRVHQQKDLARGTWATTASLDVWWGWAGHVYSHLLELTNSEEYPRLSSLAARPLLVLAHGRRIPLRPALPLPPVNASSHNMRNLPSGRAPPTFRGIPLRWPLREAGRGQPTAPRDWLAQPGLNSSLPLASYRLTSLPAAAPVM